MGVIGSIKKSIAVKVKYNFQQNCVELLKWACITLKSNKTIDENWGEENISANLYHYISNSQRAINLDIFVESEHSFYTDDILNNRKNSKSGSRIDLVFQNNWKGHKFIFNVEAKNLVTHDFKKQGNKSITKADSVQQRYINTGIDHFLSGHYPQGCLLGYVLNGTTTEAVEGINGLLQVSGRDTEYLQYVSGEGAWMCFKSEHSSLTADLEHFFFNFAV